ncbi:MAG TPA: NAD(P)/FAD-dependent oxidoreductase [Nitrososphaeraceae archaeon]
MERYDIAIVGGGPAGLSAAYSASREGSKVILFEKDASIAHNIRTSGVTWISSMDKLGISGSFYNPIKNYSFISPSNEIMISGERAESCVLDVRRVYQHLAFEAAAAGTKIMVRSTVHDIIKDMSGNLAGLKVSTPEGNLTIEACMFIDASGFNSVVAKRMGVVNGWNSYGVGAEYECYCEKVEVDTWNLMVGSSYSSAGYAWVFPVSKNRIRVGVGTGKPYSNEDPTTQLHSILQKRLKPLDRMGRIEPVEFHFGFIPNDGIQRPSVYDRLILVGDSAGQSNPLVLEGIRYAIEFGRLAGAIAAKAISKGSYKESLLEYENVWRKQIGSKINSAMKVQSRWMGLSDAEWDREIDILRDLSAEEFLDFIKAEFTTKNVLKLAMNHPKLAARNLFNLVLRR